MRWVAGAAIAALVFVLGAVQFASDGFAASAAAPGTLPPRISPRLSRFVYGLLDRAAPAPYVETTLAQDALTRGDAVAAQRYALRLPASPARDEILARVAAARNQPRLALEYFLAAPDAGAVQTEIESRAARDPKAGYELARVLVTRLELLRMHPDALARAYWGLGLLANRTAWVQVPGSPVQVAWLDRAAADFEAAVRLSPLSEQYVIAAANQDNLLERRARAEQLFRHASEIDPTSADAIAGLGVVAYARGDHVAARADLLRARALDPHSLMVRALERDLR